MDTLESIATDLNILIPIINHWFHLLSAVIWIGGLAFLVMAVTPGLEKAVPKDQIKPITDIFYRHYKKVAGILLVVLLFTGGVNLHYVNQVIISQTGTGVQHRASFTHTSSTPLTRHSTSASGSGTAPVSTLMPNCATPL